MASTVRDQDAASQRSRRWGLECAIVLALTMATQFALYGTSFLGQGVLLPVHVLKHPKLYGKPKYTGGISPSYVRSDLLQVMEPTRWLMAAEYRAGRVPLWNPHVFAGTPFVRAPIFSPFEWLYIIWPDPRVLVWIQLMSSCVGAVGAWMVASRLIGLSSWPAIVAGVIYPLTEFLMLWQGFDLTHSLAIFPWGVLAAMSLLDRVTTLRVVCLAVVTGLEIASGQVDMAGLALLIIGVVWTWHAVARAIAERRASLIVRPALATALGWGLGFLLTAPLVLPLSDYLKTSARVANRSSGYEARPPIGWKAVPLIVFPEAYGSEVDRSLFVLWANNQPMNQLESPAGSYCGAVAMLFAMPWAFLDRSRRRWVGCLLFLSILGLSWSLGLPGFVQLWRLPGLRLLSANRFVFASAWSFTLLAAIGLEQMLIRVPTSVPWAVSWGWITTLICIGGTVAGLALWPAEIARLLPTGHHGLTLADLQNQFAEDYLIQLVCFLVTGVCWALAIVRRKSLPRIARIASILMIVDPVVHAWSFHPQPPLADYYPRLPVLEYVQKSEPGRAIGMKCMPPRILESHGLYDVRGYDGVDPQMVIDVLSLSANSKIDPSSYSQTSDFTPLVKLKAGTSDTIQLHPTMDMLGLRYLICPILMQGNVFMAGGYSILKNPGAMPRAWVPNQVLDRSTEEAVLNSISSWDFSPTQQAFVKGRPAEIPEQASGKVELKEENPQRLLLMADMQTTGLVIVADRYDSNWKARVDGKETTLLRVNYMLRGVVVPEGRHQIELTYRPDAYALGVRIFQATAILLLVLTCGSLICRPRKRTDDGSPPTVN